MGEAMTDTVDVDIDRIYLDQENPRHEPFKTEADAIDYLCRDEQVIELARDIVEHGLNPLEMFGFFRERSAKAGRAAIYIAAEGNRRLCALKLLNDPDLAPKNIRSEVENLAERWSPIEQVRGVVFSEREDAKLWLDRIHGGQQNGAGRRPWNAEQKQRFSGGTKNKVALEILDFAESQGIISAEDRRKRLTTAQRFLSNVIFREELGVVVDKENRTYINRPKEEFKNLLSKFISDLLEGTTVNSRAIKPTIDEYARSLRSFPGISAEKVDAVPLTTLSKVRKKHGVQKEEKPSVPAKPAATKYIAYDEIIAEKLRELGNKKLIDLYYSICKIPLADHTPVVAIAIWAFFESLSALAGRQERTAFPDFFSQQKMSDYGLGNKDRTKPIASALQRISQNGNATKHHMVSAEYNDKQLVNDMATLTNLLKACIDNALQLSSAPK
jgi:hypothetical protein